MASESQRQRIEREVPEELAKTSEEHLLADIQEAAENTPTEHQATTLVLRRFALLLVKLSRKADASSKRLERYTRILIVLTAAIVFFAVVQIVIAAFQIYFTFHPPK
jgi:hypothetical protein